MGVAPCNVFREGTALKSNFAHLNGSGKIFENFQIYKNTIEIQTIADILRN